MGPDGDLQQTLIARDVACFGLDAEGQRFVDDCVEAALVEAFCRGIASDIQVGEPSGRRWTRLEDICQVDHPGL